MFDRISNREVTEALDTLIASIGVRDEVPCEDLPALLGKKDTQTCAQEIASRLGLPVRIELSYVPKNFTPGNRNRFESNSLAQTDWRGRGIEGITAQVSIPQNLPMFGSAGLSGYPIKVRVSENCHAHAYAFIAIMVHELSHVLLASLWSPHKDSELHTDLVPIILGFRETVRRGRKVVETTRTVDGTKTRTTSYGYLTDAQFDLGCKYVTDLLSRHLTARKNLTRTTKRLQGRTERTMSALASFRDYLSYLDTHPPKRMKPEHAKRVVELHGRDHAHDWEHELAGIRARVDAAHSFALQINHHYLPSIVEQLGRHAEDLTRAEGELRRLMQTIVRDRKILGRYVPLMYRLRRAMFQRPSP